MKTLKNLMLVFLFIGTTMLVNAGEKKTGKEGNTSHTMIVNSLQEYVEYDFKQPENFFYENSINKLKSDVVVTFVVSNNNEVILLNVTGQNATANDYVKQLLNHKKINVPQECQNKKFRLTLKLDYRTL